MEVVRWSPFRELDAMERRMRRLFEDAGVWPATVPAADVYETDDAVVVELEAPGFDEGDLEIEVTDHTLRIKGSRKEEKEEKEKSFYRRERLEKSFERRFELPATADVEKVAAKFEKGVLKLSAPKEVEAKPRQIAIEVKK